MRWKQFFTPVQSLNSLETREYMDGLSADDYNLIDVRQPAEYKSGHIPGAQLIPIAELAERSQHLDPTKPTVVYWAIGGRSRVAAQMLAGKGFSEVINMSGGIKSWDDKTAFGPEDSGMLLFSGKEKIEEVLIVAYSLEAGLQEFYISMLDRVENVTVKDLFSRLSEIEVKHQDRIFDEYQKITASQESREQFERTVVAKAMEGGLTTEEYLALYATDLEVVEEVVSLAMGIEAQALDLYQRAADGVVQEETRQTLLRIAEEERSHLKQLGKLLD